MPTLSKRALKIHEKLLEAFGNPTWRNPLPPVDELVSTILSQNTNDTNRDRAFNALRAKFPTWESVRDAKTKDIVNAIRPAGLANQKGPRIQKVLKEITKERGDLDLWFLKDLPLEEAEFSFDGFQPDQILEVLGEMADNGTLDPEKVFGSCQYDMIGEFSLYG